MFRFAFEELRTAGVYLLRRRLYEAMPCWEPAAENPSLDVAEPGSGDPWSGGQRPLGHRQQFLDPEHVNSSGAAVAKPADRLVLVLAALHAARSGAIRRLQLDDLDIRNRKLAIDGRVRPLDALTLHVAPSGWITDAAAGLTPPTRTC
ncbi:hypothetical protein [Streptomyces sp. bgisy091]|uniref:hypothetical protein n=1 Tax=Streptomyces sp. bgisy091 TaxID=3413778 RepID=UPI003D72739C